LYLKARYNGPATGDDRVAGLTLGPYGTIAITGSSDGNSGYSSSYEYATIVYRESVLAIKIEQVPLGVRLSFTGTAGQSYSIERASFVTGPWSTLGTLTASAFGAIEHVDANPRIGAGFYPTRRQFLPDFNIE
jgi:hypothetical protein